MSVIIMMSMDNLPLHLPQKPNINGTKIIKKDQVRPSPLPGIRIAMNLTQ